MYGRGRRAVVAHGSVNVHLLVEKGIPGHSLTNGRALGRFSPEKATRSFHFFLYSTRKAAALSPASACPRIAPEHPCHLRADRHARTPLGRIAAPIVAHRAP